MATEVNATLTQLVSALAWEQEQHESMADEMMAAAQKLEVEGRLCPEHLRRRALLHLQQASRSRRRVAMLRSGGEVS